MPPVELSAVLHHLQDLPTVSFHTGEVLLQSGKRSGKLTVLLEGRVEVSSEGVVLGTIETPGAILGELAALLERPHTADVRAVAPTVCHVVDAEPILRGDPVLTRHIAVVLAQRLDMCTEQLVSLRRKAGDGTSAKAFDQSLDQLAKAVLFGGFA